MKTLVLNLLILLSLGEINAQTISLTTATATSNTNGSSSSVRIGALAGNGALLTGGSNSFVGYSSGRFATSNQYNSFFGSYSGNGTSSGSSNTFIGFQSGNSNNGSNNTFLGAQSGSFMFGSNNVLIGNNVSLGSVKFGEFTVNNKLAIDNSNTTQPLIWGDFATDQLKFNGTVSIATQLMPVDYKLAVGGKIIAEELKVQLQAQWPDYVFTNDYKLPTLAEVEQQIKEKGHLANVPSACEVKENGFEVGEMARIQQEKIEELTLYIIEQDKINEKQNKEIEELKTLIKSILK